MKRKVIAPLLIAAMMLGSLSACGEASGEAQATVVDNEKTEETAAEGGEWAGQELNIAIFQGGYGDEYWNRMVEEFESSHEGVTVNMTISPTIADIIRPQIVAGNAPDFICLSDSSEDGLILSLIKEEALLDITDVFEGQNYAGTGALKDDIIDGFLESTKCAPYQDGKIYLAPFNSGPQGLIYNKTYFDDNNLSVPATWDDFFKLGDDVKGADGRALFTYQGIYPGYLEEMLWPAIASHCGEDAVKAITNYEEGSFNNPKVLEVLQKMQDISTNGYLMEGTVGMNHTESQSEMMIGHSVFITNGTWMENEMADAPREDGFEFAMAPIPTFAAGDTHYVMDSCEQFSIPAAAKNPELAKEFLRFLYSDDSVKTFAEVSGSLYATKTAKDVGKSSLSEATYNMYGIYDEPNTASLVVSFATVPGSCKVNPKDEIFNPITSVMNGEMTVEQWAEDVEAAFAEVRSSQ
ncbi:MAG: carbohydrate ABC transporter substrate-binding protein [Lachnospiraceae bacterium]|nr:carbohydrate ABC transporter substrate-binding protein [Lachnospiraceae bacterium]